MFRVECLGSSQVYRPDGTAIRFRSRKHFALLVYLALSGPKAHKRERLVGLLWPEDGDGRARHSLSQGLYALKRLLGDAVLDVRGEEVQIGPGRPAVDAMEFEGHLRVGRLADAVALYKGDFLEGFWIRGARPFEEWLDRERARFCAELRQGLRTLIREGRERGEWRAVMERSRRLIQLEPYDEHAYADLMRAMWIVGDRSGALREYDVIREVLSKELESEPGNEIQELAARIRRRTAEAKRKESERKALPAISEPPFIGRKEEYARLVSVWQTVKQGQSAGVVLTGEPGIGKTRLAEEFLKYVTTEEVLLLRGACYPFLRNVPYAPLAQALSPVLRHGKTVDSLEPSTAIQLARLFPDLVKKDGSVDTFAEIRGASAVRLQFEAVAQLCGNLSSTQPVVLLVDNLQWADNGSSTLVRFLLQRLPSHRILILATTRDESAAEWLASPVDSGDRLTRIRIPPLSQPETGSLFSVLGADESAQGMAVLSGGNPFFCIELSKAIRVSSVEEDAHLEVELRHVRKVGVVLQRRLNLLHSRDVTVLEVLSVSGEPLSAVLLQALTGMGTEELLCTVERLCLGGFLQLVGDEVALGHDLIHETVYQSLPEVRKRILHARAAAVLGSLDQDREGVAAKRASHYDRAGNRSQAFRVAIACARSALAGYALDQAQLVGELAARNAQTSEERLEACHLVGEALVCRRDYTSARSYLIDALGLAKESGDYDRQVHLQNLIWRTELDSSDRSVGDVISGAETLICAPWIDLVSCRARMGIIVILLGAAYRAADLRALGRAAGVAEKWARESNDFRDAGTALRARGMFEGLRGNLDVALKCLERRLELARKNAGKGEELDALVDLSVILSANFCPYDRCREVHAEAIKLSDVVGDPLTRARCRSNWGATLVNWGYLAEAEYYLLSAAGILKPYPDLADERAAVESNFGELYWLLGRPTSSAEHWKLANELARPAKRPLLWMSSTAGLGLCALLEGDEQRAREYCTEALRALRRCGDVHAELQNVFLLTAWLDLVRGRTNRALKRLHTALGSLRDRRPTAYLRLGLGAARLLGTHSPVEAASFADDAVSFAAQRDAHALEAEGRALLEALNRADIETRVAYKAIATRDAKL